MAAAASSRPRVSVDGKFFRLGAEKFHVRGVAYGPFAPNAAGRPFASPEQTAADFKRIRQLNANVVRVYEVPDRWFLDLADEHGLKVLVDVPWNKHLCFLDSAEYREGALEAVRRAVSACVRHPGVFAFSIANEIPPDIARWSGAKAVSAFIDDLAAEAKRIDSECLCTFANYPSTEFLQPRMLDFLCFNVYLHQEPAFKNYLARLQMMADSKPLVLGETGIDSTREGEAKKCEILSWQIEGAFRAGLAGAVVFSFTDDWWREGEPVVDWTLGLTTRDRQPKDSFRAVQEAFARVPYVSLPRTPRISVVVASFNGDRTLKSCLESLQRLKYPDFEVILVDDGSTDSTPQIASAFPGVRYLRHERNLGLSVARNTGISAATGEIIAFTDSDCRADEDWLHYLAQEMAGGDFVGMGGPNLLPPDDSLVAAAVTASPGGPAHVMLNDRQAEHIPGCNMAFYKWALLEVGGFDPIFRKAGDDVDICWRLQHAGGKIGFSPSAFVWHYRRSATADYLKQQQGYGEAESLLVRKHPEYFNSLGGGIWRGRIYSSSNPGLWIRRPMIYRGFFGSAGFQFLYAAEPAPALMFCTSLEYYALLAAPLWILSAIWHQLLPLAVTSVLLPLGLCAAAGMQAVLPRERSRWWSRPLVALLFLLQPVVRGWARYQGRLTRWSPGRLAQRSLDSIALRESKSRLDVAEYWGDRSVNRLAFVADILRRLDARGWPNRSDIGWCEFDVEIYTAWSRLQLTTASEPHPNHKQLIRCRLRPRWSLRAKVGFWALCGLELLLLGLAGSGRPWLWSVLLTLPLIAALLRRQQRDLQSIVRVFLDQVAKEWQFVAK